jgi:predicted methyltransferase MtxX (methanogen marker protein 4)
MGRVATSLPEKTFIRDFPNRIVYIGKVTGSDLKDILIYNLDKQGMVDNYIRAAEGRFTVERNSQVIQLQLMHQVRVTLFEGARRRFYLGPVGTGETR